MEKKYVVINYFTDLRDYDHPYNVGDEFPRQGVTVSEERLAELSSSRNKQRRPLIKVVEDTQKAEEPKKPGTPAQNENTEPPGTPENNGEDKTPESGGEQGTPENKEEFGTPEQTATPDVSGGSKKYSKEDIEALKLKEIREIAGTLGFKISSTSKDAAVVEFMEKQG